MNTFIPNQENTNYSEDELKKALIHEPVWDHLTEKNKQIGFVTDIKCVDDGYYIYFEIFDDETKKKINDKILKGLSIGGLEGVSIGGRI